LPFRVSYREEGKSRITFRIFGKTKIVDAEIRGLFTKLVS
jgi:hypothetical protein